MDIDAFILIGGRSSRFGSDKAFAEFGGQTLAVHAAETVEEALSPRWLRFVVSDENQFAAGLIFSLGRPVVADLRPGFGAWSGLHTALAYAQTEWICVLACDLPFVSVELLRLLASSAVDDLDTVVPEQPVGRLQPLCALYRRKSVLKQIEPLIEGNGHLPPLNDFLTTVATKIVAEGEYKNLPGSEKFFLNVNFAGDLPDQMEL